MSIARALQIVFEGGRFGCEKCGARGIVWLNGDHLLCYDHFLEATKLTQGDIESLKGEVRDGRHG